MVSRLTAAVVIEGWAGKDRGSGRERKKRDRNTAEANRSSSGTWAKIH